MQSKYFLFNDNVWVYCSAFIIDTASSVTFGENESFFSGCNNISYQFYWHNTSLAKHDSRDSAVTAAIAYYAVSGIT